MVEEKIYISISWTFFDWIDQIFEKVKSSLGGSDEPKVLGGGKIQVDFDKKQLNVFGESQVDRFTVIEKDL